MSTNTNRTVFATLLATGLVTLAPANALALPILFGGDGISLERTGAGATDGALRPGDTVTVTGALLQLQAADGSIVTLPQGSRFRLAEEGDGIVIDLMQGSVRASSEGAPISVRRGGVAVSSNGGTFTAFASGLSGLDGRVNQGAALVTAGGQRRNFSSGQGYSANPSSIGGTFTPPPTAAPRMAGNAAPDRDTSRTSSADRLDTSGRPRVALGAIERISGDHPGGGDTGGGDTGGGDTGGTGGTVPVTGTPRSDQVIVYAADSLGLDQRADVTVTVGSGGELNQYQVADGSHERLERNTNHSLERHAVGDLVFIERWADGTTAGRYFATSGALARSANQGMHLAYGQPSTTLPVSGLATYSLAAATKPTIDDGSLAPGSFTGTMGVYFGSTFGVGVDFAVDMPGDRVYAIRTPGGAADPTTHTTWWDAEDGLFRVSDIAVAAGGAACPTAGCQAIVTGFLAGGEGATAGVAYQIIDFSVPTDSLWRGKRISGAAAFTRSGFDAAPPIGGADPDAAPQEGGAVDAPLYLAAARNLGRVFLSPLVSYSSNVYAEGRFSLDDDGALASFQVRDGSTYYNYERNTAVTAELAGTEYIQIGRWNGGEVLKDGASFSSPTGRQGLTYLIGPNLPLNLPTTGIATYALKAATKPVFVSGAFNPGSFEGTAALAFGSTLKLGLDARVQMAETGGAVVYDITTPGGVTDPSSSDITGWSAEQLNGYYTVTSPNGRACPGTGATCSVQVTAKPGGPAARDLGLVYMIGNGANAIQGGALFQRNDDPSLLDRRIGMNALMVSPGTLVLSGGFSQQTSSGEAEVTYGDAQFTDVLFSTGRSISQGTTTAAESGSVDAIAWQRWTNGTANGMFGDIALTADQGVHGFVATPATSLPTSGTATYALAGATKPTIADGSEAPGSFAGLMAIAFGGTSGVTGKVGLDFDVTIGGHTYDVATTGGVADPSSSQMSLYGTSFGSAFGHPATINVATGGPACPGGSCRADVSGMLAGPAGSHAGVTYTISPYGSANSTSAVQGVAVFAKN